MGIAMWVMMEGVNWLMVIWLIVIEIKWIYNRNKWKYF
jgi:hypothetical protein